VRHLDPIFKTLARSGDIAPHPGARRSAAPRARLSDCGSKAAPVISSRWSTRNRYGLMAAYAEGMNILRHPTSQSAARDRCGDDPLRNPELYHTISIYATCRSWRRGASSRMAGWISLRPRWRKTRARRLCRQGLRSGGTLDDQGRDRRGGAGAVLVDRAVPTFQLARRSRFRRKLVSAMRYEFGDTWRKPRLMQPSTHALTQPDQRFRVAMGWVLATGARRMKIEVQAIRGGGPHRRQSSPRMRALGSCARRFIMAVSGATPPG